MYSQVQDTGMQLYRHAWFQNQNQWITHSNGHTVIAYCTADIILAKGTFTKYLTYNECISFVIFQLFAYAYLFMLLIVSSSQR